jgi:hypothetical protein
MLGRNQFLFSALDLNVENDEIEIDPYTGLTKREHVKIIDNLLRWKEREKARKSEAENGKNEEAV